MESQNVRYINVPNEFSIAEIRPRFELDIELTPEQIVERFNLYLGLSESPCKGQAERTYATLFFPEGKRHYWSPQLTLIIEQEDTGSSLRGLYGPRPAVWTMFIFFYAVIGLLLLFSIVIGGSEYMLHKSSWVFWIVPFLLFGFLSLWLVAKQGKKKGRSEIVVMHHFLMQILGIKETLQK